MQDLMVHNAEYKEQVILEYQNNPFIEALPELLSQNDVVEKLAVYPYYHTEERALDSQYRIHIVQRLFGCFQPLPIHLDLESKISRVIRQGYIARNIFNREYVSNSYRSTSAGFTIIGVSGMGKTTAINRILNLYPQVILHSEYRQKELSMYQLVYLKLDCPHDGSIKGLCLEFFNKVDLIVGTDYYNKFGSGKLSTDNMLVAMGNIAKSIAIGLIIIDEIQHLSLSKSGGSDKMLNFFVTLVNTVGVPVVLIGTPKAMSILQSEFRQARRGSGQGDMVWERLNKDMNWELLINAIWEYQWTKRPISLTDNIKNALYEESQGIVDVVVKLYVLSQTKAIMSGKEEITAELIVNVANEHLKLIKPMLTALKTANAREIAKYNDIYTGNINLNFIEPPKQTIVFPTIPNSVEKPTTSKPKKEKVESTDAEDIRQIKNAGKNIEKNAYEMLKEKGIIKTGGGL